MVSQDVLHSIELQANSEEAMVELGRRLGSVCDGGANIALHGELGAGKTTLCRGVLRGRGHSGAVKSPTYTLVEPYTDLAPPVFHFDLYRLADPEELLYMGIRDYFEQRVIALVEWPERGRGLLPPWDLIVSIAVTASGRTLRLDATSDSGCSLLEAIGEC